MDVDEIMRSVIAGIEERDHRIVDVPPGGLTDDVVEWMEADGYEFAASPRETSGGKRVAYFVREPGVEPTLRT